MKNTTLLILSLLLSITFCSEESFIKNLIIGDVLEVKKNIKTISWYKYNIEKKFGESVESLKNDGKEEFIYDEKGNLIEIKYFSGSYVIKKINCVYNKDNQLIEYGVYKEDENYESDFFSDENQLFFNHKLMFEYNSSNNLVQISSVDSDGSFKKWLHRNFEKIILKYDSKNNIISETYLDKNDSFVEGIGGFCKLKKEYDTQNNLLSETYFDLNGEIKDKINYIYQDDGKIERTISYYYNGDISSESNYYYESNMVKIRNLDSNGHLEYQTNTHTNEQNLLVKFEKKVSSGYTTITEYKRLYEYNKNDDLIEFKYYEYEEKFDIGERLVSKIKYEYEYY